MINCYGCNKSIDDMYYLLAGEQFYWHFNCLKCTSCGIVLNEQSKCYLTNGKFYCSQHYYSIKSNELSNKENYDYVQPSNNKSNSCKHCNQQIKSDDYVIRLKSSPHLNSLYHLNCFLCHQCNKKIMPGELYGHIQSTNNTELIFCNQHYYEQMFKTKSQFNVSNNDTDILLNSTNQDDLLQYSLNNNTLDLNNNKTFSSKEIMSSKKNSSSSKRNKSENENQPTKRAIPPLPHPTSGSSQSNVKRKRYRTSFKHQQLGVLKQYFQMNPNPDSKDLTVLSKRTGLQNRVLQVWFQNARAKQRKSSSSNPNETNSTMAKNFYSSILETDLNSLNKSSLDEGDEDEIDEDEDDDDENTNNDEDDNEHLTSENDSNEHSQPQIVQNQHEIFNNQQQNLCYF